MATVTTKERDFLTNDSPLRGQNYVCLSFIHPKDVLKQRHEFEFEKYIHAIGADLNGLLDKIVEDYPERTGDVRLVRERHASVMGDSIKSDFDLFCNRYRKEIDDSFNEKHEFQTAVQGIKVRGVFESIEEAKNRCTTLRREDADKFNIFVAEVGCWCPWNPDPNDVGDQEFVETQLNTLMSKYHENSDNATNFYNERKKVMIETLKTEEETKKQDVPSGSGKADDAEAEADAEADADAEAETRADDGLIEDDDPWMKRKMEKSPATE